jgi:thiol-disulfide isomerase/thioredoxin
VKLELLDGGNLDLAGYKGKNVVILDFWATWCGPCTQAMPIIEKVAHEYQDKGVLLFAVNIQEQPDDVKKFLEEAELKVAVALDKDGTVGSAYKAEAIPQTVLVGKDGTVQVVRVGLSANLEEELSKDLDALVAGKDLASEALKVAKNKKDAATAKAEKDNAEKAETDGKKTAAKKLQSTGKKPGGLNISVEGTGSKKSSKPK